MEILLAAVAVVAAAAAGYFAVTRRRAAAGESAAIDAAVEESFRRLVELSPDATFVHSGGRLVFANAAAARMLGAASPDDLIGRSPLEIVHPDFHDVVKERIRDEVEGGRAAPPLEETFVRLDGTRIDVEAAATPLTFRGRPSGLVVVREVTARKRAEEQAREAETRYRMLVEQIPSITYIDVYDPDHTAGFSTVYCSPQIEQMLGYSVDEFMNDPELWPTLLHPDDLERSLVADARHFETGEPMAEEFRVIARDGRTVWVRNEAVAVRGEDGRIKYSQGILLDITERKLVETALQASERREREAADRLRVLDDMKNTFLAAVSHELRSPLTTILGLALTLERGDVPAEDGADLLRRLASNARKLDRLLADLLDIDRLSRGIIEPQVHEVDVGALARVTVNSLDLPRGRTVAVEADPVVAPVDPAKVERIVENLVMNAVRHTEDATSIWVRVRAHDGGVLISVEDDGRGVPPDLWTDIFEPFRQGPTVSSHSPGTGIGLSLVSRFAALHGGRAWVEDREGGGASFRVFLPGARSDGPDAAAGSAGAGADVATGAVARSLLR
jgi:PAS domain S-box-containing protein